MRATLNVVRGGLLTTVQDNGRLGALAYGVPRGGAMDRFALLAANRLLGNAPDAAGLEITAGGAAFTMQHPTPLALTGADLGATWNGRPLPLWTAIRARPGDELILTARTAPWGARAYLAIWGGIDVPVVLGSRSTHLAGGFGGLDGRPLRAGDVLAAGATVSDPDCIVGQGWPTEARPAYGHVPTLRFLPGPHAAGFADDALAALAAAPVRVSANANRMGYRLAGVTVPYTQAWNLPSLGVMPGVIQVPPDGTPILLMADAQTTGGYPILGVVIAPDLPLAAQALPGDYVRLALTTLEQALEARRQFAGWARAEPENNSDALHMALAGALG